MGWGRASVRWAPIGWAQGAGPHGDGHPAVGPKASGGGSQGMDHKGVGPWGVPKGVGPTRYGPGVGFRWGGVGLRV